MSEYHTPSANTVISSAKKNMHFVIGFIQSKYKLAYVYINKSKGQINERPKAVAMRLDTHLMFRKKYIL